MINNQGSTGNVKSCTYKLVLLGESAVGKSSLVMRFVRQQFNEYLESTIGAAFLAQNVTVDDFVVRFEIWDTAGQERYSALAPMYYRGANAAVVVYDITSSESYGKALNWIKELQIHGSPGVVIALVGNKVDLAPRREVDTDLPATYAKENNLLFFETSAKTSLNVQELFAKIAQRMPAPGTYEKHQGISINNENQARIEDRKCC